MTDRQMSSLKTMEETWDCNHMGAGLQGGWVPEKALILILEK